MLSLKLGAGKFSSHGAEAEPPAVRADPCCDGGLRAGEGPSAGSVVWGDNRTPTICVPLWCLLASTAICPHCCNMHPGCSLHSVCFWSLYLLLASGGVLRAVALRRPQVLGCRHLWVVCPGGVQVLQLFTVSSVVFWLHCPMLSETLWAFELWVSLLALAVGEALRAVTAALPVLPRRPPSTIQT